MSLQNPLPVALIGITGFGNAHLKTIRTLAEDGILTLKAVTVINREDVEEECEELEASGVTIYDNYRTMLEKCRDEVKMVFIPTGIAWHERMSCDALSAGYHVYLEKPVAGTLAEVDRLIEARDKAGRFLFVGFQDIYSDVLQAVQNDLRGNTYGRLKSITAIGLWPRGTKYYTRNNWAGKLKTGDHWIYDSPLNNAFSHYVAASLYLSAANKQSFAEVTELNAQLYRTRPIESFDTCSIHARTNTGVELNFHFTHACAENLNPILHVETDSALIRWEVGTGFYLPGTSTPLPAPAGSNILLETSFAKAASAVRTGEFTGCSLEMGRAHTAMINLLHQQSTIEDFPADKVQILHPETEKEQTVIVGIKEAFLEKLGSV